MSSSLTLSIQRNKQGVPRCCADLTITVNVTDESTSEEAMTKATNQVLQELGAAQKLAKRRAMTDEQRWNEIVKGVEDKLPASVEEEAKALAVDVFDRDIVNAACGIGMPVGRLADIHGRTDVEIQEMIGAKRAELTVQKLTDTIESAKGVSLDDIVARYFGR